VDHQAGEARHESLVCREYLVKETICKTGIFRIFRQIHGVFAILQLDRQFRWYISRQFLFEECCNNIHIFLGIYLGTFAGKRLVLLSCEDAATLKKTFDLLLPGHECKLLVSYEVDNQAGSWLTTITWSTALAK
jgi:hypothetical protein